MLNSTTEVTLQWYNRVATVTKFSMDWESSTLYYQLLKVVLAHSEWNSWTQKYSRLRCLLCTCLVICLYLGSIQQISTNRIKVGWKSWLITCSSNISLSLWSYEGRKVRHLALAELPIYREYTHGRGVVLFHSQKQWVISVDSTDILFSKFEMNSVY